jgi:hypothetical protein
MACSGLPMVVSRMVPETELRRAAAAFSADGESCPLLPLGRGNINDTYLLSFQRRPLVLQRINPSVFPEPQRVIDNFVLVTGHIREKRKRCGSDFLCAEPVPTLSGSWHYRDVQGGYWRSQTYLRQRIVTTLHDRRQAWELGKILATFHHLLADLTPQLLAEPLPGFHFLPRYLADYDMLTAGVPVENSRETEICHKAVARHRHRALLLEEARAAGLLTTGPIHGDPKLDNVLFDGSGHACGLLDLDTVMIGPLHYDLGDCLRSCCNQGGEESTSAPPPFDLDVCHAILAGFGGAATGLLTKSDTSWVFQAIFTITFELAVRFFSDHLRGDRYFRVGRHGDNLRRALSQFALVEEVLAKEGDINRLVVSTLP